MDEPTEETLEEYFERNKYKIRRNIAKTARIPYELLWGEKDPLEKRGSDFTKIKCNQDNT